MYKCIAPILAMMFAAQSAIASDSLRVNGFATIAATYSDGENLTFRTMIPNEPRDGASLLVDSVAGVQINYLLNDSVDLVFQATVSDKSYQRFFNYVDMAFLRYRFDNNWSLRAGRLNSRLYMLSEYRNTSYAYLWARPPIEMYSSASSTSALDGVEIIYSTDVLGGATTFAVTYGNLPVRLDGQAGPVKLDYSDTLLFNIEHHTFDWRFSASYVKGQMQDYEYAPFDFLKQQETLIPEIFLPASQRISDNLNPNGKDATFITLGASYDDGTWVFQSELGTYSSDLAPFPTSRFGYVSMGRRINKFTPYILIASNKLEGDFRDVPNPELSPFTPPEITAFVNVLVDGVNQFGKGATVNQNSYSVGLRWDFTDKWAVKVQFDNYAVEQGGGGLFGEKVPSQSSGETDVKVLHLGVSTIF